MRWAARLKKLMSTASAQLTAAQLLFKRNFDQRVRPARDQPEAGGQVFLRRDYTRQDEGPDHKLVLVADGPFRVKEGTDDTVVIF